MFIFSLRLIICFDGSLDNFPFAKGNVQSLLHQSHRFSCGRVNSFPLTFGAQPRLDCRRVAAQLCSHKDRYRAANEPWLGMADGTRRQE